MCALADISALALSVDMSRREELLRDHVGSGEVMSGCLPFYLSTCTSVVFKLKLFIVVDKYI